MANLPAVVVLPEPCKPAIKMTAGGATSTIKGLASPPSMSTRPSLTILITCWSGRTDFRTAAPTAFSRMLSIKVFTTGSATSASSKARRTSRKAAFTSASFNVPRLPRPENTDCSLSFNESNIDAFFFCSFFLACSFPEQPNCACARKLQGQTEPVKVKRQGMPKDGCF